MRPLRAVPVYLRCIRPALALVFFAACGARSTLDSATGIIASVSTGGTSDHAGGTSASDSDLRTDGIGGTGGAKMSVTSGGNWNMGGTSGYTGGVSSSVSGDTTGAIGGAGGATLSVATGGKSTSGGSRNTGGVPPASTTGEAITGGTSAKSGGTSATSGGVHTGGGTVTGGTSFVTGGTPNAGGTLGTGGTLGDLGALAGHYDITLDTTDIDGCRTYQGLHHLNASIQKDNKGTPNVSVFLDWAHPDTNTFSITADRLTITRTQERLAAVLPRLQFALGPNGFTGIGTADVAYLCPSGTRFMTVSAAIGPDTTPPRLLAFGSGPGGVLAPFDLSRFDFSELVLPEGVWDDRFFAFADPPNSLTIRDAVTGEPIAHHWTDWPWSSATAMAFDDRAATNGRFITLDMLQPFTDMSGNPAIVDQPNFEVIDAGPLVTHVDFDEAAETHAFGRATYLSSDSPNSPCEAGNCLALDYATPTCLGDFNLDPLPPTFLAARFQPVSSRPVSVRYRVLSTVPYRPGFLIEDAGGCTYGADTTLADVVPLTVPYGIYGYATEWDTASGGWCMGPTVDVGLYLYLTEVCSYPPGMFRLLIERVETLLG